MTWQPAGDAAGDLALLRAWEDADRAIPAARAAALLAALREDMSPQRALALPIGVCHALLLAVRVATFGEEVEAAVACPECGCPIDVAFDAGAMLSAMPPYLPAEPAAGEPGEPAEGGHEVTVDGIRVGFRLPTVGDLVAVALAGGDRPAAPAGPAAEDPSDGAQAQAAPDPEAALLRRCVLGIDPDGDVEALPAAVTDAVTAAMARLDPGAEVLLQVRCPQCAHAWSAPWDIAGFVATEVAAAAQAVLAEVDALAGRYGWSERDVLAMSPWRRQRYLQVTR